MVALSKFQGQESGPSRLTTQHDDDKSEVDTTMNARTIDYPCAIADQTEEGAKAALRWARQHVRAGQMLTLWVAQRGILNNNEFLKEQSNRDGVDLTIAVGKDVHRVNGPVLAMYPDAEDLAYPAGAVGVTALAVVQWSSPLETWAREVNAEIVHTFEPVVDRGSLPGLEPEGELTPATIDALERITQMINHNNTIAAGRDKRDVVRPLLRLHDAGVILPPKKMAEWAVAHGWRRGNPKELIDLAKKINKGVRPRCKSY